MAGTIIADKIQTENAFLTLNVGQTLVATINSSGILNSSGGTMIGANGTVSNTAITGLVTASQIANVANTQLTGLIQAAQIGSANATLVTSGTLPKARLPTGSVLQVVQATTTSDASINSNSYANTGFSVSITPTATSSRILLSCNFGWSCNTAEFGIFTFGVNGTPDGAAEITCFNQSASGAGNSLYYASISYIYLPASISTQTYSLQFKCTNAPAQTLFFNDRSINGASGLCTLTATEIAV
jgi:hypothetical protein